MIQGFKGSSKRDANTSAYTLEHIQVASRSTGQDKKKLFDARLQKQPSRGVLRKRCSENMQQIYMRTPMPKCDFNKVDLSR